MELSASYPSNPTTVTSGNMNRLADLRPDNNCLDLRRDYESDIQDGGSRDLACGNGNNGESNSVTSSPMTHKESISTDGDCSDNHGRGSSDNGTDITVPDGEQNDNRSKASEPVDKRAEKRRMKRFRLTHNQTRYLMSEFTRQAHPDAAHRERLSREIPGLSPRQVQVWFQNRRAKLKRLTSDDRERMLRSRALPDDFDMAQALHSPYGNCPDPDGGPLASPGGFCHQEGGLIPTSPMIVTSGFKPYNEEYVTSPLSATSQWSGYFSPHPVHAGRRDPSPTHPSQTPPPGQPTPYMRPSSYPNQPRPLNSPLQHLQFGDPPTRHRTESLSSSHPNGPYTSAPLNRNGPLPSIDSTKDNNSPVHAPSSPNSVNDKRDTHCFEQQAEPRSSPRTPANTSHPNASHLPPALQLKHIDKDLKPALHSAPISIPNGCDSSALSPHLNSSQFGVPYAPQLISTMSLPASPFFFDQNGKQSDEYGAFDGIPHGLPDSFIDQGRSYTSNFQYAGAQ